METATLKSPAQIPAIVAGFLGFEPSDSLVVLGLGGGPSARVDITPETTGDVMDALRPAAAHWSNGVLVALYSDAVDLEDVKWGLTLLGIDVKVAVDVTTRYGRTLVIDHDGNVHTPDAAGLPASLAAKHVAASRDELVAEAARTADAAEALMVATEAYRAGDGARAWCYLDRFHALHAPSDDSTMLADFLTRAVSPRSDEARAILG